MAKPVPVLPEYVAQEMPPPSYEDIMGHQAQTSVKANTQDDQLPPLAYIDIMPRCLNPGHIGRKVAPQYDQFSTLIQAANQWLRSNVKFGVWKCETVERKVEKDGRIEMDKMIFHDASFGFNVHLRGLRMWLYKKTDPSALPQQLGLLNVVPKSEELPFAMGRTGYVVGTNGQFMFFGHDLFFQRRMHMSMTTFEGLQKTIDRLNEDLSKNPLQGSVLNVESAVLKSCEGFEHMDIDPESTVWAETGGRMRRYVQILRVFYVIGQPAHEKICLKEFVPDVVRAPDLGTTAVFQNMDDLMSRMVNWIPHQDIRVVNIQGCTVKYNDMFGKVDISFDSTDDFESGHSDKKMLKTLRLFYVTSSAVPPPPRTQYVTSKTFLPVRLGNRSFETLSQTMYRLEAWLRVTGVPIFSVSTEHHLLKEYSRTGVELDKTRQYIGHGVGKYYVTAIKVYFPCVFQEPNPMYLPQAYPWDPSKNKSESCSIL